MKNFISIFLFFFTVFGTLSSVHAGDLYLLKYFEEETVYNTKVVPYYHGGASFGLTPTEERIWPGANYAVFFFKDSFDLKTKAVKEIAETLIAKVLARKLEKEVATKDATIEIIEVEPPIDSFGPEFATSSQLYFVTKNSRTPLVELISSDIQNITKDLKPLDDVLAKTSIDLDFFNLSYNNDEEEGWQAFEKDRSAVYETPIRNFIAALDGLDTSKLFHKITFMDDREINIWVETSRNSPGYGEKKETLLIPQDLSTAEIATVLKTFVENNTWEKCKLLRDEYYVHMSIGSATSEEAARAVNFVESTMKAAPKAFRQKVTQEFGPGRTDVSKWDYPDFDIEYNKFGPDSSRWNNREDYLTKHRGIRLYLSYTQPESLWQERIYSIFD